MQLSIFFYLKTEEQLETMLEEEKVARQQGMVNNVFDILTQIEDSVKEEELILVGWIKYTGIYLPYT